MDVGRAIHFTRLLDGTIRGERFLEKRPHAFLVIHVPLDRFHHEPVRRAPGMPGDRRHTRLQGAGKLQGGGGSHAVSLNSELLGVTMVTLAQDARYRPFHTGFRFSANARGPSTTSSLRQSFCTRG